MLVVACLATDNVCVVTATDVALLLTLKLTHRYGGLAFCRAIYIFYSSSYGSNVTLTLRYGLERPESIRI